MGLAVLSFVKAMAESHRV
ncbi:hypothetical protein MHPYR_600028 [uncultured Mycobacterium sp.]|uniref:Uncharacterized protein n=1 Tax=uncultured Mycobacterium sp. TaxID=171292 RepID=A0A1Y5PJC3_9MYCO|nr:hypothetical protein MHPYR_600028 [uncultured Mycobacterium sp.]